MDIELTPEKQAVLIEKFADNMDAINEGLPAVAGNGNLVDALEFLNLELAAVSLHTQRTGILIGAILEFLQSEEVKVGFEKTGANFSGTAAPIN